MAHNSCLLVFFFKVFTENPAPYLWLFEAIPIFLDMHVILVALTLLHLGDVCDFATTLT